MPVELYSLDEALKVAPKAIECRVKRTTRDGKAKVKLRTKRYLYTLKVDPSQVDDVISKLGCKNVVDVDAEVAKRKKERAEARRAAKEKAEEKPAQAQQAAQQPQQEAKPEGEASKPQEEASKPPQ
jgi:large subunit ribosomal protein L38e